LGDHFILHLFFGQTDEEGGRYDHKIGDHGDEPAVIVDQREQVRLAEEEVKNLVEPPYQGNQEQKPPAGLLAAVGHENAFVVHGSFCLFSSAKISLFFKMTNKLFMKTNKIGFELSLLFLLPIVAGAYKFSYFCKRRQ
jgi:hypothetical protein